MDSETEKLKASIGEMQKRRVTMADGRRYLIYYTFEKSGQLATAEGGQDNVDNQPPTADRQPPTKASEGENV